MNSDVEVQAKLTHSFPDCFWCFITQRVTLIKTPDIHTLDAVDVKLSAQRVSTMTFVVLLTSSLASQAPFFLVPSSAVFFV